MIHQHKQIEHENRDSNRPEFRNYNFHFTSKEMKTFNEILMVEVLARFTGNSRGTPIAKQAFIDGAIWGAQNSVEKAALLKENQELKAERDYWLDQAKNHTINAELLEALESSREFVVMSLAFEAGRHTSDPDRIAEFIRNHPVRKSIESAINKAKAQ